MREKKCFFYYLYLKLSIKSTVSYVNIRVWAVSTRQYRVPLCMDLYATHLNTRG